jgi:hypothetical protein
MRILLRSDSSRIQRVLEAAAARKCVSHVREHDVCTLQRESPPSLKPLPLINMSARRPVSELSENIMRERESAVTSNNRDTGGMRQLSRPFTNVSKFFQFIINKRNRLCLIIKQKEPQRLRT